MLVARNKWFSFTLLTLTSLVVAWLNVRIKSNFIGIFAFLAFLMPMSVFTGRVFFKEENVAFRLIFGFAAIIATIACFGSLIYFVVDYSWSLMLILLIVLTFLLSFLSIRKSKNFKRFFDDASNNDLEFRSLKDYGMDMIFILFILFSLYALYVGKTGESIKTFWEVINYVMFFLPYFGSSFITIFTFLSSKVSVTKSLSYIILLTLVVALVPIIVIENPQTNMMARNIAWTRYFDKFGKFVIEPYQIERASSIIHKHLEFIGYYTIMVTLARLLGSDPAIFNVLFTPLFFALYAPISAYFLVKIVFPNRPKVALMSALALLFSQHNIFLLVPPGKPETLGLIFLLLSIMFCTRYLIRKEKAQFSSILIPLLFSFAATFSHPNVGVFSLALVVMSIYLRIVEPFKASNKNLLYDLLSKFGYIILMISLSLALIIAYQIFQFFQPSSVFVFTPTFNISEWIKVLFPPYVSLQNFTLEGILNLYLNNFTYIWYALFLIGIFLSHRWCENRKFLLLFLPLISMSFVSMILQQFFYPRFWDREYYRFFYYLNFISYPIVGISLYAIIWGFSAKYMRKITVRIKFREYKGSVHKTSKFSTWKSLKIPVWTTLFTILLSSMVSSSVYGGFPRVGSLGPYSGGYPTFVSEHDVAAMKYISERESRSDRAFFIIGDSDTAAAALLEFGEKNYLIEGKYRSFVSYRTAEGKRIWSEIISSPSQIVLDDALKVFEADIVYLVLTYRIGESLQNIVSYYSGFGLFPVFKIAEKIYVYEYPY